MPAAARSRLTDGTVILVAGEKNGTGDPIQQTIDVQGHDVTFDALGVAAVGLTEDGEFEAMAAGGPKSFVGGETTIELPQRAGVALWQDSNGVHQGVLQDYQGEIPAFLSTIRDNWTRLSVPQPLSRP